MLIYLYCLVTLCTFRSRALNEFFFLSFSTVRQVGRFYDLCPLKSTVFFTIANGITRKILGSYLRLDFKSQQDIGQNLNLYPHISDQIQALLISNNLISIMPIIRSDRRNLIMHDHYNDIRLGQVWQFAMTGLSDNNKDNQVLRYLCSRYYVLCTCT